ncbi:MAG: Crp/Fnr family transcriptional regulator [Nitrospirae bacterium]|nr:Crp/Fnr family transcriptional regulator [Nitrospirota bacterium]
MRALLPQIPLFADLEPAEIDLLYRLVKTRVYSKGAMILQEDDPGDALFMIVSGRAKVVHLSEDGREIILDILGQGDFFGEMALLDQEPRSANVTAIEPSELLVLERSAFLGQVVREPKIAIKMLIELSRRLRRADEKIQDLVLLDVYGRVARALLRLARKQGRPLEDGCIITRRPTHQELADMVGASRETVSRVLADLNRRGVVRSNGRALIIENGEEMLQRVRRGHRPGRVGLA